MRDIIMAFFSKKSHISRDFGINRKNESTHVTNDVVFGRGNRRRGVSFRRGTRSLFSRRRVSFSACGFVVRIFSVFALFSLPREKVRRVRRGNASAVRAGGAFLSRFDFSHGAHSRGGNVGGARFSFSARTAASLAFGACAVAFSLKKGHKGAVALQRVARARAPCAHPVLFARGHEFFLPDFRFSLERACGRGAIRFHERLSRAARPHGSGKGGRTDGVARVFYGVACFFDCRKNFGAGVLRRRGRSARGYAVPLYRGGKSALFRGDGLRDFYFARLFAFYAPFRRERTKEREIEPGKSREGGNSPCGIFAFPIRISRYRRIVLSRVGVLRAVVFSFRRFSRAVFQGVRQGSTFPPPKSREYRLRSSRGRA